MIMTMTCIGQGMYAFFGLAKCCNRKLTDKLPCCCCGNLKEYRCTQCDKTDALDGRPHPLIATFPPPWRGVQMCNGALIGFKAGVTAEADDLLERWAECALDKRCIAPLYGGVGRGFQSTRGNHRQDQAGLSMLVALIGGGVEVRQQQHGSNASHGGDGRAAVPGFITAVPPAGGGGGGGGGSRGSHRLACSEGPIKVGFSLHHDAKNENGLCKQVVGEKFDSLEEHDRNPL